MKQYNDQANQFSCVYFPLKTGKYRQCTALLAGPQVTEAPDASKQSFSWTKQWYPVALAKDLDTHKPNAIKLLGKDLVLWKDGDSEWRCFNDVCPHRLVCIAWLSLMKQYFLSIAHVSMAWRHITHIALSTAYPAEWVTHGVCTCL